MRIQEQQTTARTALPALGHLETPPIGVLLAAVAKALQAELGRVPGEVRIVSASRRTWSRTWEIAAGEAPYILKWLPRRAERELELTQLTQRLFAGEPHVRTPRVACNPTADTFLVEKLPGTSLQGMCTTPPLLGLSAWVDSRCRVLGRVGRWLRRFHDAQRQPEPAPLSGVKAYVLNREPAFAALERDLVDAFWRALDAATAAEPVRVHGDFTPHNILVAGDSVAVIDLAGINEMEFDTHAFDAAAMVVGLEESWRRRRQNHLRFFPSSVQAMVGAFLSASGIVKDDRALPVCYAVRHLTRIYNIVRTTGQVPGPRTWHVQRLRLAVERPDAILQLAGRR